MKIFNFFRRKPEISKPNKGKLCECYGDIHTSTSNSVTNFPLKEGYHTGFLVGECIKCGGLSGFPHSNLQLAIKECTPKGKEFLEQELKYEF